MENVYLHIELLDAALQIYDISFSDPDFTMCRVDDGRSVQKRPWNEKRLLWMNRTNYNIYDASTKLVAVLRSARDRHGEQNIIEVEIFDS